MRPDRTTTARRPASPGRRPRRARPGDRRGSVLVVVLALLGALMLLGFLFYTIASQERENARYFTASQKWYAAQLDPDELMDFALEQIIVGPQDDLANSALWGGRYSLLAGLVGDDLQPYSGAGVNVIDAGVGSPTGRPAVDQDQDGNPDPATGVTDNNGDGIHDLLTLDAGTLVTQVPAATNLRTFFAKPDVPYTYPDINSPFLSFVATEPVSGNRVVIPSYHRPQYLRGLFTGVGKVSGAVIPPSDWYTNPATLPYVLRPHAARTAKVFNYATGRVVDTGVARFTDASLTSSAATEGQWSQITADPYTPPEYDADPDGDFSTGGLKEAIYVDLDYPVEETPDGTSTFIPLFAISIFDLDGLLNLNAHGNMYGDVPADLSSVPANPFQFLSESNEGRRRHEVNVQYGLMGGAPGTGSAMPAGADYAQHQNFFGVAPTTPTQLANMEWWFIAAGRGELDGPLGTGKATRLFPGRWGEGMMLADALNPSTATRNPYAYPRPGQSGSDEAAGVADGNRGSAFVDVVGQLFPPSMIFPAPGQPEDHQGQGSFVAGDGKTPWIVLATSGNEAALPPVFQAADLLMGRLRVPLYSEYWLPPATTGIGTPWAYALGVNFPATQGLVTAATTGLSTFASVYSGVDVGRLIDNPDETLIDPELARNQITDSVFGPEETAALFMSNGDRTNNGIVSRLIELVPASFDTADDAATRRRRFTSHSADLKSYVPTLVSSPRAGIEISNLDTDFPAASTFPRRRYPLQSAPWEQFPAGHPDRAGRPDPNEPLREEARALLGALPNVKDQANADTNPQVRPELKLLTRKLSVNHVAAASVSNRDGTPRYLLRPLTPHPGLHPATGLPTLPATPVTGPGGITRFGTADYDLWLAEQNDGDYLDGYLPAYLQTVDHDGDSATAVIPDPVLQEWHARRDRQNLARDIYTLLYLFGSTSVDASIPPNVIDPYAANDPPRPTNPNAVYSDAQMFEMAQFAVNLVDAMDPDDTMTCFVFDMNFADGYTPNDDGYTNPVTTLRDRNPFVDEDGDSNSGTDNYWYLDPAGTPNRRGMVYGVEGQKLAFSEALAVLTKIYKKGPTASDHKATDWDDHRTQSFTYVELQNTTPGAVRLGGGWSIVTVPSVSGYSGTIESRAVTLNAPLNDPVLTSYPGSVSPAGLLTVGTVGDPYNIDRTNPSDPVPPAVTGWSATSPIPVRPSNFNIDVTGSDSTSPSDFQVGNGTDDRYEQIAPANKNAPPKATFLDFDLMSRENTAGATGRDSFRITRVGADASRDIAAVGGFDLLTDQASASPTTPKAGGWLSLGARVDANDARNSITGGTVTFQLRRRLNLNRTTPAQHYPPVAYTSPPATVDAAIEQDNPWVIVDTIAVPLVTFDLSSGSDIQTQLANLVARQRLEALANVGTVSPVDATGYRYNNLGLPAQLGGGNAPTMTLWQRHFDRAFASLADVLSVPLYGPREVTAALPGTPPIGAVNDPRQTAAVNILFPDGDPRPTPPSGTLVPGASAPVHVNYAVVPPPPLGNLWYRLLEFVEVPQKYGDNDGLPWFAHYGGPAAWLSDAGRRDPPLRERLRHREFGKINLNTLRDPQVLAGLLDAGSPGKQVCTFQNQQPIPIAAGYLPSANAETWAWNGGTARDWWLSLLASRDGGLDPYATANGLGVNQILPGVPSAKPFLDFGAPPPDNSTGAGGRIFADFQQTLLRTMPGGTNMTGYEDVTSKRRSLLELGNFNAGALLGSDADFSSRYRLLGKVLNHGTTRSNTFVAFIQADFFETGSPIDHDGDPATPEVFQIGAKRPDSPGYRGVFVIDRSLALELLRRRDLPPADQGLQYPQNSVYRTFSFAREPGPDQRPKATFDWKKLILSRRIITQ